MKRCPKCGKEKNEVEFWKDRSARDGLHGHCKECGSTRKKEDYKNNPEKYKDKNRRNYEKNKKAAIIRSRLWYQKNPERGAEISRNYRSRHLGRKGAQHRKHRYQLSTDDYEHMVVIQNGFCAICGGVNNDGKALAVDHDHETGELRGLLCRRCNSGLGMFQDKPDLMKVAIDYLENHFSKHPDGV